MDNVRLITDLPSFSGSLGFREYGVLLSRIITNSYPRFTVGIFGGAGTGKTSLMLVTRGLLDKNAKILTLWVNASRYASKEGSWLKNLLREIRLTLKIHGKLKSEKWKAVRKTLKGLMESSSFSLFGLSINFGNISRSVWNDEEMFYAETMNQLQDQLHRIRYNDPEFRIVLFINDLDKLSPERALEVLSSIESSILFSEGIVVVIGMDPRVVDNIAKVRYSETSSMTGFEFMDRIFQFRFNVPQWSKSDISELLDGLFLEINDKDLQANKSLILNSVPLNPRGVKRFINSILLTRALFPQPIEQLIVVQALGNNWHEFFEMIQQKRELLKDYKKIMEDPERFKEKYPEIFTHYSSFLDSSEPLRQFLDSGAADILIRVVDFEEYRRPLKHVETMISD